MDLSLLLALGTFGINLVKKDISRRDAEYDSKLASYNAEYEALMKQKRIEAAGFAAGVTGTLRRRSGGQTFFTNQ